MAATKKHLGFGSLRIALSGVLNKIRDQRQNHKIDYSIHDTMMSGFACMFFQDPSLLEFQERVKQVYNQHNLETMFDVKDVPKESQMREIIDSVDSSELRPVYKEYFSRLQRGKHLKQFELFPNQYIVSLDGTQYFSSDTINCNGCLTREHKNGTITYSHSVVQAALMHPDRRQVIPLWPEEIKNTDGTDKQDCETNAGKRLIETIKQDHPHLGVIIVGDGLFSKQPFIEKVTSNGMNYILVAKPDDHKIMMEWVEEQRAMGELKSKTRMEIKEFKRKDKKNVKTHVYEWINNVPVNGKDKTVWTNWLNYKIVEVKRDGTEKTNYKNSWVTDFEITEDNVERLVRGGRCRWKIENECFNTRKNQGYHLEHNYGHGSKNLCYNFYLLTLLAFFHHQIFELTDRLFQDCRSRWRTKRNLWEKLRALIAFMLFESWEELLQLVVNPRYVNVRSP